MVKVLKTDFEFDDDRGKICQILSVPSSQVNYLYTKKGAKRGKHYHKENCEIFYVISGEVKLLAGSSEKKEEHEEYTFCSGDVFMVEPYTIHDFIFTEDTQMIVIYDKGVEKDGTKDIYV